MRGKIRFEYEEYGAPEPKYIGCLDTEDLVESYKLFEEYRKYRTPVYLDDETFEVNVGDSCYVESVHTAISNKTRVEENFITVILN